MKIQYLGTAAAEGIPGMYCDCDFCKRTRKEKGVNLRTRSGAVLNDKILIDYSPDIYTNSVKFDINLSKMTDLIVTHTHIDHFAIHELSTRDNNSYCKGLINNELNIYCTEFGVKIAKEAMILDLGREVVGINFRIWEKFVKVSIDDVEVTPLPAKHGEGDPCYIFYIEENGKSFVYGNDTAMFPSETIEFLKDKKLDCIAMDCTFGNSRECGNTHMGFVANLKLKEILLENKAITSKTLIYITHFSHDCNMLHTELKEMANPHNIDVIYDGMIINL